mgnify:CR=1 FL=1
MIQPFEPDKPENRQSERIIRFEDRAFMSSLTLFSEHLRQYGSLRAHVSAPYLEIEMTGFYAWMANRYEQEMASGETVLPRGLDIVNYYMSLAEKNPLFLEEEALIKINGLGINAYSRRTGFQMRYENLKGEKMPITMFETEREVLLGSGTHKVTRFSTFPVLVKSNAQIMNAWLDSCLKKAQIMNAQSMKLAFISDN